MERARQIFKLCIMSCISVFLYAVAAAAAVTDITPGTTSSKTTECAHLKVTGEITLLNGTKVTFSRDTDTDESYIANYRNFARIPHPTSVSTAVE